MTDLSDTGEGGAVRLGMLCAIGAALAFSLNDVTIKFLSTGYPLHQIVLARSCVAFILVLTIIIPLEGGIAALKTKRPMTHLLRGFFVVLANSLFFMAIAAMPLADATAVFFVSPLIITGLSVLILGEAVGLRRWAAVGVGLIGVLVIVRPTSDSFQVAALLAMASALFYALLHIMTRKLGVTEKASTMAIYIQATFIIVSVCFGLIAGDGRFAPTEDPSLRFLLGPWVWPTHGDMMIMAMLGVFSAAGGYLISQAYRVGEAGLIAPFEYVALVMSVIWGFVIFAEVPDGYATAGIVLILGSGLYLAFREARLDKRPSARKTSQRR